MVETSGGSGYCPRGRRSHYDVEGVWVGMYGLERFIGEVLDEKYRLERLLGQGGMGAVFLATHLGTERPVALKVITPQLMRNEELVARFKREARAAGRLRHPNVVDVTDFGFAAAGEDRIAYLVMEYLDGCTLGEVLAEESRLPLDWVVDILEQVCSAVDEAHRQGIVHRDLKPDNIWLEPNRLGGYRVKVLDFGIAKLADATTGADAELLTERAALSASIPHAQTQQAASSSTGNAHSISSPAAQPLDPATQEAATLLQPQRTLDDELSTRLFDAGANTVEASDAIDAEAGTRLFSSAADVDRAEMLGPTTAPRPEAQQTAPASGLTRVGAIMGTPLYMSPEQCRGEQLDARSDIYSLGVIAYQMLAGETPFKGELLEVMRQHGEAAPPSVRERNRQLPPRVDRLIQSALAKNPNDRPARAAGFASALRAYAEGTGKLLQRAFALYSERFPTFFRISVLAYLPVFVVTILQLVFSSLNGRGVLPKPLAITFIVVLALLSMITNFLAPSIISGMSALLVTQWFVAPLRPVNLRAALAVLRKRWWPFFTTGLIVTILFMLGFILLFIPGLYILVRYSLYAPVVLMEGLKNRAAMRRSNELTSRARRTVWAVVIIHVSLPFIISALVGSLVALGKKAELGVNAEMFSLVNVFFSLIFTPLLSITTALLYLKMRQAGGESLEGTSTQLAAGDAPHSQWQQRMRERLTINSGHPSRLD